jgi:CheY-like chemotaxis protein
VPQPEDSRPVVLVAEDDPAVRTFLTAALPLFGCRVLAAADGAEAVALFRAERGGVALALLDVQMPGLDGPRTLAALHALDPGVRCLFMTGHPGDYEADGLLGSGVVGVLDKPFTLHDLESAVRRALGGG